MTQTQKFLLLVVAVLAVAVLGRFAWALVLPTVGYTVRGIASLFGAVPSWGWWVIFGLAMSFLCPFKRTFFGRGCRSSSRCSSRGSTVNV